MKRILFLAFALTVLATSGCLVDGGRHHDHDRGAVIVPVPVVVVH